MKFKTNKLSLKVIIASAMLATSLPALAVTGDTDQPIHIESDTQSLDMQGNVVLLALDEVKAGTLPEAQKKAMVQGITQNNAQIAFEAMMSNLRKDAKIKLGDVMTQQQ